MENKETKSTHRILYRLDKENLASPSIILDEASHKIGIVIDGSIIFLNIEEWHEIALEKIRSLPATKTKPGSVPSPDWDPIERNPRISEQIKELEEVKNLKEKPKDEKQKSWKFWKKIKFKKETTDE